MNKQLTKNSQTPTPYFEQAPDEIDLLELWRAIWSQKWKVILITLIFSVGSVIFALYQPNLYTSEALLVPAGDDKSSSGLGALAGQFGGLASLAGVSLSSGGGDKTEEALAILKSREFITQFVRKSNILIPLFALQPMRFSQGVALDPSIYDESTNTWVREVQSPYTAEPTDWEIYKAFSQILTVSTDKQTGLVTVSIEWYLPEQAQQWVTLLIKGLNEHIKSRDVSEAQKSINFIREKIKEVSLVDMQAIFFNLIEAQGKTIMLAEVRDEYAFRTIDPAVVPLEKSKPKRALICVLGTLLGGMLGTLWALVSYFVKKRSETEPMDAVN
ncbi:Wzz/FepE/Etk N-terminal domain-containing protein [Litoribrevibacter albus]|uniref:LPS biosynthesis protein n=1 Tax=Litoribrevibacter albus TaxID=1473156 RepID=A0AA37SDS9_9GAMM|nr:Wzz/FepE/Etk N-terminal domain-containing protein [Litoribrevibacter albus]GLQ33215.1 LPS biosynthesis protein [Litoribrevibacter albus]